MSASNKASKQTQTQLIVKYLNTQQRLQIIYTIAKSEVETMEQASDSFWQSLVAEVDTEICSTTEPFQDSQFFLGCLFILTAAKSGRVDQTTLFLLNLMTRAHHHLQRELHKIQTQDEAAEIEVSLSEDADLQSQMDFIVFILRKGIVKYDLKQGQGLQIDVIFREATAQLQTFITLQQDSAFVQLTQFAPYAIWFEVLYDIFFALKNSQDSKQKMERFQERGALKGLLVVTFQVLLMYKNNSMYYMIKIGQVMAKQNNSHTGEQTTVQPAIRRMSKLFTEILDLLVSFLCAYLTTMPQDQASECEKVYELLIKEKGPSTFTLLERLTMLSELNFLFQKIEKIQLDDSYWQTIREGLFDLDQACRKLSLGILKSNLKLFEDQKKATVNSAEQFELLWSTFFDIYDTLESFGSHLTKAVWHRTELFYDFMRKFDALYASGSRIHPLEDMRMWLLVIYHRVGTHNNLKIRRQVQKRILQREYITRHMIEFYFNEFINWLNQCLIFKDVNNFTQFSKNAHLVLDFYARYFKNESQDLGSDLRSFFLGFSRNKSHSQMILISLKVLSKGYPGDIKWIGASEIKTLYDMIDVAFKDQVLSGRYLCFKFILRMMSFHIKTEIEDWSCFFKLMGYMPLEFFSSNTIMDDQEAKLCSQQLVNGLKIKENVLDYLIALFQVKAMSVQMPKFGKDTDLILEGIFRLIMDVKDVKWLQDGLFGSLQAFDAALSSSYMSVKLVEEKISYFVKMCKLLHKYGNLEIKKLVAGIIVPRIPALLSRYLDHLSIPLSRDDELLPSEKDKVEAVLGNLAAYADLVNLSIQTIHLDQNRSENCLESFVKTILTSVLNLTRSNLQMRSPWSGYLLQISSLVMLEAILSAYAVGIQQSLKRGQATVYITEDLFSIGRPILQNLLSFKVNVRVNGVDSITKEQDIFLTDLDLNPSKVNQKNTLNVWKILANMLNIFQYDQELKNELITVYNPQISKKTFDFMDSITPEYNQYMYYILKISYIPQLLQMLKTEEFVSSIEEYQQIVRHCWATIKQLQTEVQAEQLLEFLELAFNEQVLESYQNLPQQHFQRIQKFQSELAKEMLELGSRYWLILRSFFNHLMLIFARRPDLMLGLEHFVCGFGTTRECRSLDAEIKLYKLQTILPEVIPKKYENLPLEEITYQGAYIRTMTLIIVEGILRNYLTLVKQGTKNKQIEATGSALSQILLQLLNLNLDKKQMAKSDQPFSEAHRLKLRTWQFLIVMQNLINDPVYQPDIGTLNSINQSLWPILKQNHLQSVRQYMETFTIKFVMRYPEMTLQEGSVFYDTCLDSSITKPQLAASLLLVAGFVLLHTDPANCVIFKRKIFDKLVGYCGSNSAHCRCIAQYFILKLGEQEPALIGTAVKPLLSYLGSAKDVQKMMKKYQEVLNNMLYKLMKMDGAQAILNDMVDQQGEFVGLTLIEELARVTTDIMCEFRAMDEIPLDREDWWKADLEQRKEAGDFNVTVQAESSNYQRKILPWEQIEFDQQLQKRIFFQRRRNEIILCASLIDKVPNLAGLARTSEIMNASSLIINNSSVCQLEEFKGISVTSEKWLPIYEVKERDLLDYLSYQKSNGYQIVGIEQTANSKMLHEFKFPTRCVLLLGKEKEGIPQEYYSVLDHCVEIPQFGLIRSLNVHVSGALCLWEYTKQHMPTPAPSTQTNVQQ